MLEAVISAAIVIGGAVVALVLMILTVNIMLVRKLRSIIPPSPDTERIARTPGLERTAK